MYEKELKMAVSIMSMLDFYTAVASNDITEDVIAKANELIAKDASDKAKAKAKRAEKAGEAVALEAEVLKVLGSTPKTATEIVDALGDKAVNPKTGEALKPQWVSSHLRAFVEEGKVIKTEVKGEKGKVMGYTLA